ncbi:MAG: hypothetical protein ACXW16_10550, partial [Burkholderiaceae bacterium]
MDGSLLRLDDTQDVTDQGVALDHLRLGWRPIVGRDRRVLGVRIEVSVTPGTSEASSAATLGAVIAALADQTTSSSRGIVVLAPTPLSLGSDLQTIAQWKAKANVMLEVGADALTARQLPLIEAAHQNGNKFVLRSSSQPLPRDSHRLFTAVIDAPTNARREGVPALWVRDVHTRSDVESALARGAQATIGWPLDEPMVEPSAGLEPMRRAVLDIVRLIQGDADVIALE